MNHYSWKRKGDIGEKQRAIRSRVVLNLLAFFIRTLRTLIRLLYSFFLFIAKTISPKTGSFLLKYALLPGYKVSVSIKLRAKKILARLLPVLENISIKESSLWLIILCSLSLTITIANAYSGKIRPENVGRDSLFFKILTPEEQFSEEVTTESAQYAPAPNIDNMGLNQPLPSIEPPAPTQRKQPQNETSQLLTGDIVLNQPIIMDYSSPQRDYSLPRSGIETYTVHSGDTLSEIADRFNISLNTVVWENGLKPYSTLRLGQKLTILPVSGVTYKARSGDTLAKISKLFGVSAEDIALINDLALTGVIHVGDTLVVPDGKPLSSGNPIARSLPSSITSKIKNFLTTPSESRDRYFIWPTTSRTITQPFRGWRHTGIDIANHIGEPVFAAAQGVVETAGWNSGGYGFYIIIRHPNGLYTLYGHNSKLLVSAGQVVAQGQHISNIGSTGHSTGPHLHFEIRSEGNYLNPLNYY